MVVTYAILGVILLNVGRRPLLADAINAAFLCHDDHFISKTRKLVLSTTRSLHEVLYEDRDGPIPCPSLFLS